MERERYIGGCRVFLLVGLFLIGHAIYKYCEYAEFEARDGVIKLMSDLQIYVRLYEWGGKNAVAGFILAGAAICLTASLMMWRKARSMPRFAA